MRARQAIEQGGFARIGHADQDDFFHEIKVLRLCRIQLDSGMTTIRFASLRRMITSVVPTRT